MADDTLIGRDADLATLTDHLTGDDPIVLLTGPAGVGKSAVAEVVAEHWSAGPVYICELDEAEDDEHTVRAVAEGLGCDQTDDGIRAALEASTGTLIVLDGSDAALEVLAKRLAVWRADDPSSRVLITARRRIPIPGAAHLELAALSESEAVALFESRARKARPGFQVAGGKTPVIKDVVGRLDRMPEAIGLAADRMQVLSLDALDRRLAEPRIAIGAGSDPRGPMRKAFDTTWKNLDAPARLTLQRCAVFAGPFDAAAAEAIVLLPPDGPSVPTALATLKDHSLVSTEATDGALRFWMLDAIRQFAWDTLEASGERADVQARFVTWYAALAGRLGRSGSDEEGLTELNRSWDNLIAAATWSMDQRPGE
ncbi:MAG: AAA family ATPase, partial [Myxococcota bacterium]|nr:AAA family ATPase [Myxococcota bacterium]